MEAAAAPRSTEARFHDRVEKCRRDHLFFAAGGAALSLILMVVLGLALYAALVALQISFAIRPIHLDLFRTGSFPWMFALVYAVLFFAFGFCQYRRQFSRNAQPALSTVDDDRAGEYLTGTGPYAYLLIGSWHLFVIAFFSTFPSLIFHFIRELSSGMGFFASQEAERIAFEVVNQESDTAALGLLREKVSSRPEVIRQAMQLLGEMRFILLRRDATGFRLVRTLRCEELLTGAA